MHCTSCGKSLAPGTRFCPGCGAPVAVDTGSAAGPPPPPPYTAPAPPAQMLRPRQGRVIAGVCAAFALHFGWDVTLLRVLVAVITFLTGIVLGVVAYLVAWLIIPDAPYALSPSSR